MRSLRRVIRQIVAEASANGTPFHWMAIQYRADDPYASLIPDELRLAGIPMAGPGVETLADTSPGRTLLGLMTLAEGEFQRDDVMSWLTGCPVSPPAGRTPGFNPSYWDFPEPPGWYRGRTSASGVTACPGMRGTWSGMPTGDTARAKSPMAGQGRCDTRPLRLVTCWPSSTCWPAM